MPPTEPPCPGGHTYHHLGTEPDKAIYATWTAAHATCEAPEPELVGETEDER
jgi:hypothetical protein